MNSASTAASELVGLLGLLVLLVLLGLFGFMEFLLGLIGLGLVDFARDIMVFRVDKGAREVKLSELLGF